MKKVKLEYKWLFWRGEKVIDVPEKWNELTPKQFIAAINMFMGAYSEEDFLHEMFGFAEIGRAHV